MTSPVIVIIRDGWGINPRVDGNAVAGAKTPNCSRYLKEFPWSTLDASGLSVGLPEGYQGSSEVGHLNMGAGRVVVQELKRINDSMESGEFFREPAFVKVLQAAARPGAALHVMGLVQDEGVHSHQDHLFHIMRQARKSGVKKLYIHFFADGRDTPPRSSLQFLQILEEQIAAIGLGQIGTVIGRYYAMDRSKDWKLVDKAYAAIVDGVGRPVASAKEAIQRSYREDTTPDNVPMFDEYIPPSIIQGYPGVKDGDAVLHFNYRQDRAIELTMAFVEDKYAGQRSRRPKITYAGLTRYYDEFQDYIIGALDTGGGMDSLLGEVVSKRGIRQLRLAETQKFRHVTSFFNGKRTKPYALEDQIEIPSVFDPAIFASHPEMNAYDVLEEGLKRLDRCEYGFIAVNWANCDMVGHTGDYNAAVRAVEVVDDCVGQFVRKALTIGARILLTADHGNAEEMIDYNRIDPDTGKPAVKTSHTTNPVECIYLGDDARDVRMARHGKLCDIAPTVLKLMGIPLPREMTAQCLIL